MTVQAQDAGKPMLSSTVTVYINVIDENDNAPVFETNSYNVDVYENATVNVPVVAVMATDRDSGKHRSQTSPPQSPPPFTRTDRGRTRRERRQGACLGPNNDLSASGRR